MTIVIIAMASNLEKRLPPSKRDTKDYPQVWSTYFPHQLTLTDKEKRLNSKAVFTYKDLPRLVKKTKYKDLALSKPQN